MKSSIEKDAKPSLGFSDTASEVPYSLIAVMKHNSATLEAEMAHQ